jgi:hypothetical protein
LQLDELRLAVGSPISRAKEDEHRAFGGEGGLQSMPGAKLIDTFEVRHDRANTRTNCAGVDLDGRRLTPCRRSMPDTMSTIDA